ncbi:MAG: hypothetical protein H6709_01815 [Kofleriaceae bacterium]|nr:hypothetical protein [Kofleriaceae bacterium]
MDAAALAAAPAPAPPLPTTLPDLVLEPTAALIADADLADAVDRLAAARSYEGRFVGFAGKPSSTWEQWQQIAQRASHDDLVALLRHEAPVVRTYAAYHVVDALAADLAAVMPLFRDRTEVETVDGCFIDKASLAQLLVDDLCHRRATPGAAEVLRVVAAAATPTALGSRRCAAPPRWAPWAPTTSRAAGWARRSRPTPPPRARDVLAAADPTSP